MDYPQSRFTFSYAISPEELAAFTTRLGRAANAVPRDRRPAVEATVANVTSFAYCVRYLSMFRGHYAMATNASLADSITSFLLSSDEDKLACSDIPYRVVVDSPRDCDILPITPVIALLACHTTGHLLGLAPGDRCEPVPDSYEPMGELSAKIRRAATAAGCDRLLLDCYSPCLRKLFPAQARALLFSEEMSCHVNNALSRESGVPGTSLEVFGNRERGIPGTEEVRTPLCSHCCRHHTTSGKIVDGRLRLSNKGVAVLLSRSTSKSLLATFGESLVTERSPENPPVGPRRVLENRVFSKDSLTALVTERMRAISVPPLLMSDYETVAISSWDGRDSAALALVLHPEGKQRVLFLLDSGSELGSFMSDMQRLSVEVVVATRLTGTRFEFLLR